MAKFGSPVLAGVALSIGLLALGGCAGNRMQDGNILTCPRALFLAGADRATGFGPSPTTPQVPENAVLELQVVDLKAPCRLNRVQAVSNVSFSILLERRNTAIAETYSVPYFVAVTDANGAILARHDFVSQPRLPAGVAAVTVKEQVDETLPLADGQRAVAFEILVGLRVNEREYEYNLKRAR